MLAERVSNMSRCNHMNKKLYKLLAAADETWMQRKRKITTASIFAQMNYANLERRGLKHTINKSGCDFTHQALCSARKKLPQHLFRTINKSLQTSKEPQIYAIDGSKMHVHPSFLNQGCKSRTNGKSVARSAKLPLMMLSSMLNVNTRTCFDSQITHHFNERKSAVEHINSARPGDTLLFDRGYFSRALFWTTCNANVRGVFRLRKDALKSVKSFYGSSNTSKCVDIAYGVGFMKIYLYKYFIDGKKYVCATNFASTVKNVKSLYALRWRVETSFRRLKTDLSLEHAHSMTPSAFVQEVELRILFDTHAILSNSILNSKNDEHIHRSKHKHLTYFTALDNSLRLFHAIQIVIEKSMTWHSVIRILTQHPP